MEALSEAVVRGAVPPPAALVVAPGPAVLEPEENQEAARSHAVKGYARVKRSRKAAYRQYPVDRPRMGYSLHTTLTWRSASSRLT
jgi:hypothetical protein